MFLSAEDRTEGEPEEPKKRSNTARPCMKTLLVQIATLGVLGIFLLGCFILILGNLYATGQFTYLLLFIAGGVFLISAVAHMLMQELYHTSRWDKICHRRLS